MRQYNAEGESDYFWFKNGSLFLTDLPNSLTINRFHFSSATHHQTHELIKTDKNMPKYSLRLLRV